MLVKRTLASPSMTQAPPRATKELTEEEAELLEYERSGGKAGVPYKKEVVFAMLGAGSSLIHLLVGWEIFKRVWFGWMGMPGWW